MQPNTSALISLISSVFILTSSIINGDDAAHRLQLLPQTCVADDNSNDVPTIIRKLVQTGGTSKARLLANECLLLLHNNIYASQFSSLLKCCSSSSDIIIETYITSKEKLYENEDYLQTIIDNLNKEDDTTALRSFSDRKCVHSEVITVEIDMPFALNNAVVATHGSHIIEQWNACCSYWRDSSASKCINSEFCCELVEGTDHHLLLPALREPIIRIRLENRTEVIEIEQDGLLHLYDVSGVLWPAGHLLGLCLSNPVKCGAEEIFGAVSNVSQPFVLELGAGVGFASIALSKTMRLHGNEQTVIATDISKSALDLTVTNAYRNGVGEMLVAMEADYRDKGSLLEVKDKINLLCDNTSKQEQQGFDIIIGSSLQSLFDGTQNGNAPLWLTLDTLLSKSNPSATVLLSHVRSGSERIQVPDETIPFELVRRIPGDQFNMKTRDGQRSDFELVIFRRRQIQSVVE